MHLIPLANTAHHARALHQPFYIEGRGHTPSATGLAGKAVGHGSSIEKHKYDETPHPRNSKHLNKNGTALFQVLRRYSLLNSCTDPHIASDQFYTLKTGDDSNAKALRMLVFSWRQDPPHKR
ncbi:MULTISPECIES: hypothetical protein [Pseudomonas]|uniref:hypothetical protein n=1 Tax=Pseudomonas TaxID=286 RepID=UPI001140D6E0|nr:MULTISPECIES: hypothetical protein [unclassified Pseudomonas]MCV2229042.1 hypothetical protein [Pseudomonas sp. AU10]